MRTDGLFDFRVVEVPFRHYGEEIVLYPVSDVHFGSPNFAREKWERFLEEARKERRQKIFMFLGDTFEALSSSERRFVLASGIHDTTALKWEEDHARDIKNFYNEVKDVMMGRVLSVFSGNHYIKFSDGTTSDMALASMLKAPFIGTAGWVILILRYDKKHSHQVKIFVHHGTSEARMKQARANFKCDLLLMGHNHQMHNTPVPDIDCQMGMGGRYKVVEHVTRLVRCGSFLKSFEAGLRSYPVDTLMAPAMLGCCRITLTPTRRQITDENRRIDNRWVEITTTM